MRIILEAAIALAVSDYVRGRLLANRQGCGTPNLAAVLVANVEDLAWKVTDGVV